MANCSFISGLSCHSWFLSKPNLCSWGICSSAGLSCSRFQFFARGRQGSREGLSPAWVRVRPFSETAVCYSSKDGPPKDGGSDAGKVRGPLVSTNPVVFVLREVGVCCNWPCSHRKASARGREPLVPEGPAKGGTSSAAPNVEIRAPTWRLLCVSPRFKRGTPTQNIVYSSAFVLELICKFCEQLWLRNYSARGRRRGQRVQHVTPRQITTLTDQFYYVEPAKQRLTQTGEFCPLLLLFCLSGFCICLCCISLSCCFSLAVLTEP